MLSDFLKGESGASAAEYALILSIISAGLVVALTNVGTVVANLINNGANAFAS